MIRVSDFTTDINKAKWFPSKEAANRVAPMPQGQYVVGISDGDKRGHVIQLFQVFKHAPAMFLGYWRDTHA